MAERIDLTVAELRALLDRIEQHHLEADDWAVVDALISDVIDRADAGQEWVTIDLPEDVEDDEEPSDRKTGPVVGVEDSTFEKPRR